MFISFTTLELLVFHVYESDLQISSGRRRSYFTTLMSIGEMNGSWDLKEDTGNETLKMSRTSAIYTVTAMKCNKPL